MLFVNLLLAFGWLFPVMLIHEFGHALVAKLLHFRIFSVTIGRGKNLFAVRFLGIPIKFNRYPSFGLTLAVPTQTRYTKLFMWLYVLGGPAIQIVSMLVVFMVVRQNTPSDQYALNFTKGISLVAAFFIANGWTLLINLIPRKATLVGVGVFTDGYQLLRIPFAKRDDFEKLTSYIPRLEAAELLAEGKSEAAIEKYEELLKTSLDDIVLKHDLAIARLHHGEYDGAREIFLEALGTHEFAKPVLQMLIKNNIAWVNAVIGSPELIDEALRYSYEVERLQPNWVHAIGTRGTVYVRAGELDRGIEYLNRAYKLHSTGPSRASCACFIAVAHAKKGAFNLANEWLETAKREHFDHNLIQLVAEEMSRLRQADGAPPIAINQAG